MTYWNRNSYVLPKLTTLNADPMGKLFRNSNSVCLAASILFPVIEPKANRIVKCMYKHLPVVLDFIQYKLKTKVTVVVGMVNSLQKNFIFCRGWANFSSIRKQGCTKGFPTDFKIRKMFGFLLTQQPSPEIWTKWKVCRPFNIIMFTSIMSKYATNVYINPNKLRVWVIFSYIYQECIFIRKNNF